MTFTASLSLFFAALLLGAMAANAAGRGGVTLFALEGVMLSGGLTGVLFSHEPAWISLLAAGGAGAAAACFGVFSFCGAGKIKSWQGWPSTASPPPLPWPPLN